MTQTGCLEKDTIDIFFELIEEETGEESYTRFLIFLATQRKGQAFFNALPRQYQEQIQGTIRDPFYKDDWKSIREAVDWLTSKDYTAHP